MKITSNQMALEEHARASYLVEAAAGFTREDANNAESWVHVIPRLRAKDKLSVLPIDRKWYGEFIVTVCEDTDFALVEVHYRDLVATEGSAGTSVNGYEVSWGGPSQRYRVKRTSDGAVMVSGMEKAEAEAWAANGGKPASAAA